MKQVYDYDHWLDAVQENGLVSYYVPEHLKTPELRRIADQG